MTAVKIKMTLLSLLLLTHFSEAGVVHESSEPVMLANTYHPEQDIVFSHYRVSEKLDGIRGVWNGKQLMTRNGNHIYAPRWFLRQLPPFPVEGELWAGRGLFHVVQQTILDQLPNSQAWHRISFMLFDIPFGLGPYHQRYQKIKSWLLRQPETKNLRLIRQYPLASQKDLDKFMQQVVQDNGEGIMLRDWYASYHSGRSDTLLKMKPYIDEEAQIIGYKNGKGKYENQIGALLVRNRRGTEFYIGSGLTDQQRESPPEIGSWITYRYDRVTQKGKPRFARLLRERVY
ncbi:DNA ligase [Vibrio mangrovi]|uniref:DNA ligase n=1 Tax=Vibrio mangrovi TaxID=474394 RepID=A0A1Y6IST6_9VIBR|nr:DNA ligase [Vibrio mangrovi]MDW6004059.1 DNA ligase [Vibrio mangrovi]SMR99143.1 DNA ligase [Vibrio mangrovi]